ELVDARAGLRALRDRYSDEYPPVQDVLTRIASLEGVAVPQGLDRVLGELRVRESEMQGRITSASQELSSIPPRTIEEARLTRRVAIQETLYNELRSRVETARLAAASSIPDVQILDRATVPVVPTNDRRVSLAAVIFMGLIGGSVGLAILLDRMDARFRYPAEVTRDMGLEILASIPRIESGKRGPDALTAAQALEAFRELRVQIGFAYGSAGPLTLTITSPSEGEGKSFISANLAVAFAQMGRRTLLIDADTRRGDVHHLLGARRVPGLTDYLRDRTGKDIIQNTEFAHLDFVGCGTRGTSTPELLASRRMAEFLGTMKRAYEVILVDSPPLASGGDPVVLSSLTGNLVLVIRTGSTEKQLAAAKLEMLSRLPLRVLGAILNDVEQGSATYRYYHSYYLPGYAPGEEDEERDGGAATRLLSGASSARGRDQAS
ncbi:MAG: polysaccharide biosynthesis tyrosine autokinase, partial [Gemmatimonadota bacterium]|nr:polysaccharide biosynthesis tyrosine autokinase [Gemmatimonadota bacterium]